MNTAGVPHVSRLSHLQTSQSNTIVRLAVNHTNKSLEVCNGRDTEITYLDKTLGVCQARLPRTKIPCAKVHFSISIRKTTRTLSYKK